MFEITSRSNQKLKSVRKTRDGKIENKIFIEGTRLAEEAAKSGISIFDIFFSRSFFENPHNSALLELLPNDAENFLLADELFKTIGDTKNPQGIVLIAEKPRFTENFFDDFSNETGNRLPLIVFLNEINNPSNLGAIFRTAEAAGALGIFISENSADPFSPKALRASMGSALRLPSREKISFQEALDWAEENGFETIAADINSKTDYRKIDWRTPRLLVFGSEAHGLSEAERNSLDEDLFIPMEDPVESLNLAVASAVILFEARRQIDLESISD